MARSPLSAFHPLVRAWFTETLGAPSAPQVKGWPAIAKGDDTLILAPTGTGKTLAAFLWELNQLIVAGLEAPLGNSVQILYVSPLKALNNDVQRNLELPLTQLADRFRAKGEAFPEIRVAVRTGDTPASARARMLRKAPHILITTPESLHIMLTSTRGRGMFGGVRAVIVDEIHAIAGTKRGAHLALTLERLDALNERRPQRIGLSATQKPLEEIAKFLSGVRGSSESGGQRTPRGSSLRDEPTRAEVQLVDCGLVKKMETVVQSPVDDLNRIPGGTIWPSVTPVLLEHVRAARTTLIFVNNRGQAEKVAVRLNALAGEDLAMPYHGSLSRERRLYLEQMLKSGAIRALVATSSLELGIDIGTVDVVVQVQSPKRVSSGLQRVGRAGHSLGAVSRGVFIPTHRDDAVEAVAIAAAMRDGDVEPTVVVQNPLDVLSQVIVAIVSIDDHWTRDTLAVLVRRAYPYHRLGDAAFDEVLEMLSGKYPADVSADLDARITWDRVSGRLSAPRSSRMMAVISGGTIPDRGLYTVNLPDRTRVGELDEEFVHETRIGDVFQLGSTTWKVQAIEHDRVIVLPAPGAPARMPFWHGEYLSRAPHLAARIGELRRRAIAAETPAAIAELATEYRSDEGTMRSVVNFVREQRGATGIIPDERQLVVEQFRDETGSMRVVVHSPFGGRVNAPWGMALANRVREWLASGGPRGPLFELQIQTGDDGIMLRLPPLEKPIPLDVIKGLTPDEATRRVLDEIGSSSLFGARFRMNAARALLLPRGDPRRRMPLWLQRLKALDLLQNVREYPSFPILVETYRDVLTDAFDMDALARVLARVARDELPMHAVETRMASPFASPLQFGFVMDWLYGDDAPRAEQRAALLSLDRALLDEVLGAEGGDAETLAALDELLDRRRGISSGSRARNADELSVLLDRAGDLTHDEIERRLDDQRRGDPLAELAAEGRVVSVEIPTSSGAERRIVLVENLPKYVSAFGTSLLDAALGGEGFKVRGIDAVPAGFREARLTDDAARTELLTRLLALGGALSIDDILRRYAFDADWVEHRLEAWRKRGKLVRGTFGVTDGPMRWVSRRMLEIARRRELAKARRQIRAVDLTTYARFVERWMHVHPETRPADDAGVLAVIRQLYGVARSPEWWTREAFRVRVGAAAPDTVTRLAAAGELVWIGDPPSDGSTTRITSVRLLRRGSGRAWLADDAPPEMSDDARTLRDVIVANGASFFDELAGATALPSRRLRDAMRELVAGGVITSDAFESLRMVARWRSMPRDVGGTPPDPTRWIPQTDAFQRPIVRRRPSLRRMPKWRRPDLETSDPETWPGRWSLAKSPGVLGPAKDEATLAESIGRQWLDRYGVVSREHWRRERPAVPWRAIYLELRRLEMRGEVRRGYFVDGLSGVQFAKPEAVDLLRAEPSPDAPVIVMAAADPANVQNLPLAVEARDAFSRGRGRGAWIATISGSIVLTSDRSGRAFRVRPSTPPADVTRAARAMAEHLVRRGSRPRDISVETIDGEVAARSSHYPAFAEAGFRRTTRTLRFYAPV